MKRAFLPPRTVAVLLASVLAAGCGGGVWIGYYDDDDDPPRVSLSASVSQAAPGEVVRLAASASDDEYVDRVRFYRYDGDRAVAFSRDDLPPYETTLVVPSDGRAVVQVFADAIDARGNVGTSGLVTVTVR